MWRWLLRYRYYTKSLLETLNENTRLKEKYKAILLELKDLYKEDTPKDIEETLGKSKKPNAITYVGYYLPPKAPSSTFIANPIFKL